MGDGRKRDRVGNGKVGKKRHKNKAEPKGVRREGKPTGPHEAIPLSLSSTLRMERNEKQWEGNRQHVKHVLPVALKINIIGRQFFTVNHKFYLKNFRGTGFEPNQKCQVSF